jgi:hypothetical protein
MIGKTVLFQTVKFNSDTWNTDNDKKLEGTIVDKVLQEKENHYVISELNTHKIHIVKPKRVLKIINN